MDLQRELARTRERLEQASAQAEEERKGLLIEHEVALARAERERENALGRTIQWRASKWRTSKWCTIELNDGAQLNSAPSYECTSLKTPLV